MKFSMRGEGGFWYGLFFVVLVFTVRAAGQGTLV